MAEVKLRVLDSVEGIRTFYGKGKGSKTKRPRDHAPQDSPGFEFILQPLL